MNKVKALVLSTARALDWLPPLAARVSIGYVFVTAGWGKLQNLPRVTEFFRSLGIPAPELQAPFVASVELVCGAMVLVGLFARLASIPLIGVMVVAILTAKMGDVKEVSDLFQMADYLNILFFAWIFTAGPGKVSLDNFICKECAGTCSK